MVISRRRGLVAELPPTGLEPGFAGRSVVVQDYSQVEAYCDLGVVEGKWHRSFDECLL
jgi:hypothetical protein